MKTSRLTAKQERFVQGLVAGMSQRAALKQAYPSSVKWKDASVDVKASRMMAQAKIRLRFDELVAEAAASAIYDRQRAIEDLTLIVDTGLVHIRQTLDHMVNFTEKSSRELADMPRGVTSVIAAIDRLDKLLGLSATADGGGKVVIVDDV